MPAISAGDGNFGFALSIPLLLLRLDIGAVFLYHGIALGIAAFAGHSQDALPHFPIFPPMTWALLTAFAEILGGGLALIGLFTRLAVLPLIAIMLIGIITVHARSGFSNLQSPPGYEYNLTIIALCSALLLLGAGMVSIDALIFRRGLWAVGPQPLQGATRRTP